MTDQSNQSSGLWQKMRKWLAGGASPGADSPALTEPNPADITDPCCGPTVHIFYRGKSDDRLYVARDRTWQEVRYFQPNGLKVFCAVCRRRVY